MLHAYFKIVVTFSETSVIRGLDLSNTKPPIFLFFVTLRSVPSSAIRLCTQSVTLSFSNSLLTTKGFPFSATHSGLSSLLRIHSGPTSAVFFLLLIIIYKIMTSISNVPSYASTSSTISALSYCNSSTISYCSSSTSSSFYSSFSSSSFTFLARLASSRSFLIGSIKFSHL